MSDDKGFVAFVKAVLAIAHRKPKDKTIYMSWKLQPKFVRVSKADADRMTGLSIRVDDKKGAYPASIFFELKLSDRSDYSKFLMDERAALNALVIRYMGLDSGVNATISGSELLLDVPVSLAELEANPAFEQLFEVLFTAYTDPQNRFAPSIGLDGSWEPVPEDLGELEDLLYATHFTTRGGRPANVKPTKTAEKVKVMGRERVVYMLRRKKYIKKDGRFLSLKEARQMK
jgi:hypothetical protein